MPVYPNSIWDFIERLYKSGKYSVEECRKQAVKALQIDDDCVPSREAIKWKIRKHNWRGEAKKNQEELLDKAEERVKQKTEDRFAELGMPKDTVLQKIIDMINSTELAERKWGISQYIEITGMKVQPKKNEASDGVNKEYRDASNAAYLHRLEVIKERKRLSEENKLVPMNPAMAENE
jgi:hypothetical protein